MQWSNLRLSQHTHLALPFASPQLNHDGSIKHVITLSDFLWSLHNVADDAFLLCFALLYYASLWSIVVDWSEKVHLSWFFLWLCKWWIFRDHLLPCTLSLLIKCNSSFYVSSSDIIKIRRLSNSFVY